MQENPPGGDDSWSPLTAQLGDATYSGWVRMIGGEVEVVSGAASRRQRLESWDHPANLAERLLIDIHTGQPAGTPPPPPDKWVQPTRTTRAGRTDAPPNNLVGLALLAAFLGLGAALAVAPTSKSPLTFGFVLTGWVLAVMAHEFAHAATAYAAGDHTVRDKGYLSFDPRRYGDIGTSLVIPLIALALGGIGFPGGAVYLRNDLMRSRAWRAAASLAGPAATLVVLLVLAIALNVWRGGGALYDAVAMLAFLQATALILNLLPLPGLDGFNAIRPFLPARWTPTLRKLDGLALLILLAAVFLVPGFSAGLFGTAATLAAMLGAPVEAMQSGWDAFHFWK